MPSPMTDRHVPTNSLPTSICHNSKTTTKPDKKKEYVQETKRWLKSRYQSNTAAGEVRIENEVQRERKNKENKPSCADPFIPKAGISVDRVLRPVQGQRIWFISLSVFERLLITFASGCFFVVLIHFLSLLLVNAMCVRAGVRRLREALQRVEIMVGIPIGDC